MIKVKNLMNSNNGQNLLLEPLPMSFIGRNPSFCALMLMFQICILEIKVSTSCIIILDRLKKLEVKLKLRIFLSFPLNVRTLLT